MCLASDSCAFTLMDQHVTVSVSMKRLMIPDWIDNTLFIWI